MLRHHVTQLVNVPVFEMWAAYLWDAGTRANLVSRPVRAGGIDLQASPELISEGPAWALVDGNKAMAMVPSANSGISKIPAGPFHKIVSAFAISS